MKLPVSILLRVTPLAGLCVLGLLTPAATAQTQVAVWHSKTTGPGGQLIAFFPKPNTVTGSPELLVVPLLGSQRRLLPDGRLQVWVGRSDGTPLADTSVTLRVSEKGNALASGNVRVVEQAVHTNQAGVAEVRLVAPNVPPASEADNGGGGGPPAA
jgi:hypothetical protein